MFEDTMIDMGVSVMLRMLKDSKRARKWQKVMLKVFGAIARAYKSEQEFHDTADKELNS